MDMSTRHFQVGWLNSQYKTDHDRLLKYCSTLHVLSVLQGFHDYVDLSLMQFPLYYNLEHKRLTFFPPFFSLRMEDGNFLQCLHTSALQVNECVITSNGNFLNSLLKKFLILGRQCKKWVMQREHFVFEIRGPWNKYCCTLYCLLLWSWPILVLSRGYCDNSVTVARKLAALQLTGLLRSYHMWESPQAVGIGSTGLCSPSMAEKPQWKWTSLWIWWKPVLHQWIPCGNDLQQLQRKLRFQGWWQARSEHRRRTLNQL